MIVIPAPGSEPYDRSDPATAGAQLGRELLGGFLALAAHIGPDGGYGALQLEVVTNDQMGVTALWLRGMVLRTFTEQQVGDLEPQGGRARLLAGRMNTAWLDTHRFLNGLEPYFDGGLRICCRACLVELLSGVTSAAGTAVLAMFGGDAMTAHRYVDGGGMLPVAAIPNVMN